MLRQITSFQEAQMPKTIGTSELQEKLNTAHSSGLTWREIAALYDLNVCYVYDLAMHNKEPKSPQVRLGCDLPEVSPTRPAPASHAARLGHGSGGLVSGTFIVIT